jgi:hypothetical protein
MRLKLYSSIAKRQPNLVCLQAEDLDFLPTVLVCPIRQDVPETIVRSQFAGEGELLTALCELARPIHRQALHLVGSLDESASRDIMQKFLRVQAR